LPSVEKKHSAKKVLAECYIFNTQQRSSLPSVKNKILDKKLLCRVISFTEGFLLGTRQRVFLPSTRKNTRQNIWHSEKSRIPVVQGLSAHYELIFRHSDIVNHSQTCAMCGLGHPHALWVITALQLPLNCLYVADHQEQQPLDSLSGTIIRGTPKIPNLSW
jgi:hypothetical protein